MAFRAATGEAGDGYREIIDIGATQLIAGPGPFVKWDSSFCLQAGPGVRAREVCENQDIA